MRAEILKLLDAKDQIGVSPKWIGQALELLLRIELARIAAAEKQS
jgi:hypothetical protein